MSTPPLNGLRAFEAAARHMSFKKAAEELCVTHGAVSRHIQKLEEFVGARLFHRRHRQVELTPAGAVYILEIRDAFRRIHDATATLMADSRRQTLKLRLPPTFAIRWLVPRLAGFQALHADISVQISTPYEAGFERDVDMAVSYQRAEVPAGIVCERLFEEILLPVHSPRLAVSNERLVHPNDLARHVLLHSMIRLDDWRQWLNAAGANEVEPESGLRFENSGLVYQALAEGLGVAIGQYAFVIDDILAGRVIAPFRTAVRNDTGYYLIYPESRIRNRIVAEFHDWITAEARKSSPGASTAPDWIEIVAS